MNNDFTDNLSLSILFFHVLNEGIERFGAHAVAYSLLSADIII